MRKAILYVPVLIICAAFGMISLSSAEAQNKVTDTTATVVSYWKKGDTRDLLVKISKEKNVSGRLSKDGVTYEAAVKVLDETDKSYTVEWRYKNVNVEKVDNPIMKGILEMSEGQKVVYKTDELGAFKELVNWKELRKEMHKALDRLEKELGGNQAAKAAVGQVKEIYTTKANIESSLKDIQLYHSPYGAEYTLNERITAETVLPNILGGDPLPAKLEVEMTDLKPEKNYCKIVTRQKVDEEKVKKVVLDFFKKMAKSSGKPLPKDFDIPALTIDDIHEHEIELAEGWVKRAYFKRTVQSGPSRQTETYEITMH